MADIVNFKLPDILDEFEYPEMVVKILDNLLILDKVYPGHVAKVMGYTIGYVEGVESVWKPKLVK